MPRAKRHLLPGYRAHHPQLPQERISSQNCERLQILDGWLFDAKKRYTGCASLTI